MPDLTVLLEIRPPPIAVPEKSHLLDNQERQYWSPEFDILLDYQWQLR